MLLNSNDDQSLLRQQPNVVEGVFVNTPIPGKSDLHPWLVIQCCSGSQCRISAWELWYQCQGNLCVSTVLVQEKGTLDMGSSRGSLGRDTCTHGSVLTLDVHSPHIPGLWKSYNGTKERGRQSQCFWAKDTHSQESPLTCWQL